MRSLRISVVDRCDLRCQYCMPEEEYVWLPQEAILTFDEIDALVEAFAGEGIQRLRLTGGEPLLRPELPALVERLAQRRGITDLAMTTNGTRLAAHAEALQAAGLHRVTVSLDTLERERFRTLTRRDRLDQVRAGIECASAAGFRELKMNTVVMRGFNDDELVPMLEYGRQVGAEVRFIEYMDVGGATGWNQGAVVSRDEMLERLSAEYGPVRPEPRQDTAPADRFLLPDGTRFGIVASVSAPFCSSCDRSRITADGMWYLCLYARDGTDLRGLLRREGEAAVRRVIRTTWPQRTDRGAEERHENPRRGILYQVDELRQDPHREMHTRGG